MDTYSITREFRGAKVLLTGASGYVGSVVLEQLLRCTDVDTVYCLLRPKRDQDPQQRLDKVLHSTLFHKVRDTPAVKRARAVAGDICTVDLGLSRDDRQLLESEVDIILHCAADINLEAEIKTTLQANVEGARAVLALARRCSRLRAMVHTSSAYVNINMPSGSAVQERIYPLMHGGVELDAEEIVQSLMGMDTVEANRRVKAYLGRWNFPNTYTFGKNLGEKVLAAEHARSPLPLAIVRPSLICCVALEPLPGYTGNLAGPNGICAALATGLYDSLDAVPFQPDRTWDIVPADYVGHTILAAAAAESAATIAAAATAVGAETAYSAQHSTEALVKDRARRRDLAQMRLGGCEGTSPDQVPLISSMPKGSEGAWCPPDCRDLHPDADQAGHTTLHNARSWQSAGADSSSSLCGVGEAPRCFRPVSIYHAAMGSNTFVTFQEGWSYWRAFVEQHPPPYRLAWGLPGDIPDTFVPSPAAVQSRLRWTSMKVAAAALLLDLMGKGSAAKALRNGLTAFAVLNNSKLDQDLTFVTHDTVALAARMRYEDAVTFPLVWKASGTARTPDGRLAPSRDARRAAELSLSKAQYATLMMAGVYQKLFRINIKV